MDGLWTFIVWTLAAATPLIGLLVSFWLAWSGSRKPHPERSDTAPVHRPSTLARERPFELAGACPGCGLSREVFPHLLGPIAVVQPDRYLSSINVAARIRSDGHQRRMIGRECRECGHGWNEVIEVLSPTTRESR